MEMYYAKQRMKIKERKLNFLKLIFNYYLIVIMFNYYHKFKT